jgi:hypothetical protein
MIIGLRSGRATRLLSSEDRRQTAQKWWFVRRVSHMPSVFVSNLFLQFTRLVIDPNTQIAGHSDVMAKKVATMIMDITAD